MKRYLKLPKEASVFEAFVLQVHGKKDKIFQSPLPQMSSDKYPNCFKEEQAFLLFFILKISLLRVILVVCI